MAPEGLSIVSHSQSHVHSNDPDFSKSNLFVVRMPRKKKKVRKRKCADSTSETSISNKKIKPINDLIVLDSNSDSNSDDKIKMKDDNVVSTPIEQIIVCDSDSNEPVIIQKVPEIIQLSDSEDTHSNIFININKTVSVDKIMNADFKKGVNEIKNKPVDSIYRPDPSDKNYSKWAQSIGYPKSWTEEMIKFYTQPCDKNRNFDYVETLKTKPSDWWINRADIRGPSKSKRNYIQCRRCGKNGHIARECRRNNVCYICGEYNHLSSYCPNTLCLTCGRPSTKIIQDCNTCRKIRCEKKPCGICGQICHEEVMCPSKWRRHLILESSSVSIRLNPRKCCYNCAEKGHFGFECPYTQDREYPQDNPLITSFFEHRNLEFSNIGNAENIVIFVSEETTKFLCSKEGKKFLEHLSKDTNSRVEFFHGVQDYVRIIGRRTAVRIFKNKLKFLKFCNSLEM